MVRICEREEHFFKVLSILVYQNPPGILTPYEAICHVNFEVLSKVSGFRAGALVKSVGSHILVLRVFVLFWIWNYFSFR
jgi:hypothetical protein